MTTGAALGGREFLEAIRDGRLGLRIDRDQGQFPEVAAGGRRRDRSARTGAPGGAANRLRGGPCPRPSGELVGHATTSLAINGARE